MEQESIFVGIDVAKAQLDVAVRPAADRWEVSHDDAGIGQLVSQLKSRDVLNGATPRYRDISPSVNCPVDRPFLGVDRPLPAC